MNTTNRTLSGMDASVKQMLYRKAAENRLHIIESVYSAQSGHPGGSLSMVEIVTYLYFFRMNIDPEHPDMPERDRFVLSKGHCAPALYAALAMKGFFPVEELCSLRKMGHFLQGHPDCKHTPGIDMSSGSLGQGISVACGMAESSARFEKPFEVYAVLGDGELQEGQVWEAAMFAAAKKLSHLCAFIDCNRLQISGTVQDVLDVGDVEAKFKAFGWNTCVINGHDYDEIDGAWHSFKSSSLPTAIICNTIKGKGVSFMENNFQWHGNAPSDADYETAKAELQAELDRLTSENGGE